MMAFYLQDLDDGIGKINSFLLKRTTQDSGKGAELFGQDDLEPLGLGTFLDNIFSFSCFFSKENFVGKP
jgi:hypothetical protein